MSVDSLSFAPKASLSPLDPPATNVLLVDDDPQSLLALESVLSGENYRLVKAQTSDAALLALMSGEFAAIVLDVQMPDIDGIELARLIKQRKRTQHIPIIFLTAHFREDEHAVLAYDVGAVDYLTKPVHPGVLRSKVNVFVELFRKTHALAAVNCIMEAEIEERRTAEERFRTVVEAAPSAIVVFDPEGRIQLVNSQAEHTFGLSRGQLLERRIGDLFDASALDGFLGVATNRTFETTATRPDSSEFPVEVDCRPIHFREGTLSLASVRDLSERMRLVWAEAARAEAEAANEAKDRFLAMLSHELRTPLSPILLSAAMLEQIEDCPDHIRNALAIIQRNVKLETRLIDDLLDLARIRSGKLKLNVQPADAHEVLREALRNAEPQAQKNNVRIVQHLDASHARMIGDPARLQQVFWNLLANALKFTAAGGEIVVRTSNPPGTLLLRIEFHDNGIGIEPTKLGRIFDAFEQAAPNPAAGLGMGLAICKALIEMHQGTIEAQSAGIGKGSSFIIQMECSESVAMPETPPPPEMLSPIHPRILLVEDHRDTAETLRQLLSIKGYTVRTAGSVGEALEIANGYEFDVLVSDIGLPDGRGTDLLTSLRRRPNHSVLAIAMSGFGREDDIENSRRAGFIDHLTKPVEFSRLEEAIRGLARRINVPRATSLPA